MSQFKPGDFVYFKKDKLPKIGQVFRVNVPQPANIFFPPPSSEQSFHVENKGFKGWVSMGNFRLATDQEIVMARLRGEL